MPLPELFSPDKFESLRKRVVSTFLAPTPDTVGNASGTNFSLTKVHGILDELELFAKAASDDANIREHLKVLYDQARILEDAVSIGESLVRQAEEEGEPLAAEATLPGCDCSLAEVRATAEHVAELIEKWLEVLSSGPPEVPANAISFDAQRDLIGTGAYGKVFRGMLYGTDVAVKVPNFQLEGSSTTELEDFRQEIRILRKIFHPNVVLVLGACTQPGSIQIVFELMDVSMKALVSEPHFNYATRYDTRARLKLVRDVARGIAWLHSPGVKIIHRDLKLDNIMIDKQGNAKVADFGLSMLRRESTVREQIRGNLLYRAPELMAYSKSAKSGSNRSDAKPEVEFSEKIDVYAYALLVWEIFAGDEWYPPYPYDEPSAYCDFVIGGGRPVLGEKWPPLLCELERKCWETQPAARPSMSEVVGALELVEYEEWKRRVARAISSTAGREFWLKFFADESPSWREFRLATARHSNLPARRLEPLRMVLCADWASEQPGTHMRDVVTMDKFNIAQCAFGPFFAPPTAERIIEDLSLLVDAPWFHGHISRQVAEERLKTTHRDVGTFLARVSMSQPDVPFVISYVASSADRNAVDASNRPLHHHPGTLAGARTATGKTIHHLKVRRPSWASPELVMDGQSYSSLAACVEAGRARGILLRPCDTTIYVSPYEERMPMGL